MSKMVEVITAFVKNQNEIRVVVPVLVRFWPKLSQLTTML